VSALCGFREWKPSQRRPEGSNLVCTQSKSVQDIEGDFLDFKRPARQVPGSFDVQDIEGDFLDFKRPARQVPGSFDLTQLCLPKTRSR